MLPCFRFNQDNRDAHHCRRRMILYDHPHTHMHTNPSRRALLSFRSEFFFISSSSLLRTVAFSGGIAASL